MGCGIDFLPLLRRFSSSNSASIRNLTLRTPFVRCFGINWGWALFDLQRTSYQYQQNETQSWKRKHWRRIRIPLIIRHLIPVIQLLQRWCDLGFRFLHRTLNQSMHIRVCNRQEGPSSPEAITRPEGDFLCRWISNTTCTRGGGKGGGRGVTQGYGLYGSIPSSSWSADPPRRSRTWYRCSALKHSRTIQRSVKRAREWRVLLDTEPLPMSGSGWKLTG